jgi:DNA polymerase V
MTVKVHKPLIITHLAGINPNKSVEYELPIFSSFVQAGFPSPADDYLEGTIDLNRFLITNPAATFMIRVQGESMTGAGIFSGDVLVVDKSRDPKNGDVIVAVLNGEFTIKRLVKEGEIYFLKPENPNYENIILNSELDFRIWGVVTYVLHNPNGKPMNNNNF